MNPQPQNPQSAPQTQSAPEPQVNPASSTPQPQVIMPGENMQNPEAQQPAQPVPTPQPQVETPQAGEHINPQQPQPAMGQTPTPATATPQPGDPIQAAPQKLATQPAPQNPQPQAQPAPEIIHHSNVIWIVKTNFNTKLARLTWYKDGDIGLQVIDKNSNQPTQSVFKLSPKLVTKVKSHPLTPQYLTIKVNGIKYNLSFALSFAGRFLAPALLGPFNFLAHHVDPNINESKWWVENLKAQMNSQG